MKDFISTTYTFTPGASGVGTVNLSGISSFDIKKLVSIINQTRGVVIYATASNTTGYTALAGSTLTLFVDTTGHNSADILQVVYNDSTQLLGQVVALGTPNLLGTGTIDATSTANNYSINNTNSGGSASFVVMGLTTSGATLVVEGSDDNGVTYNAINAVFAVNGLLTSTITTDGQFRVNASARTQIRLRVSVVGTGSISVASTLSGTTGLVALSSPLPTGYNIIGGVNNSQINGVTMSTDVGASSAGTQRVVLANESIQDLYVAGQSAQTAVVNNILTTTAGANATDIIAYRSFSIQIVSSGTAGTILFEGSNDNINFIAIPVFDEGQTSGAGILGTITASVFSRIYVGSSSFRYLRLRIVTTITGGTVQAFSTFSQVVYQRAVTAVAQVSAGNLNANIGTVSSAQLAVNTQVIDVASAAITTTTTSSTITPSAGISYEVNIPVTAVTGTSPTLQVTVQESDDTGGNWFDVYVFPTITTTGMYRSPLLPLIGNRVRYVQTVGGTTPSFTRQVNRVQSNTSAQPYKVDWSYASASGGITNTTDVVLAGSAGALARRYITAINVQNASATTATEVVLKDGSTIIWRGYVGAQTLLNSVVGITFPTPLKTSLNSALNFACITTAAQVYVNAQGYNGV